MLYIRKTPEEKEQKQNKMANFANRYEEYLASLIKERKIALEERCSGLKTLYEGWLYGVYVAILDHQQEEEDNGKLFYLFENIPESTNKYKLSYSINADKSCDFGVSQLSKLPKSYLNILKRHNFDFTKEKTDVSKLIATHRYKLDETVYIHHCDNNELNNSIKNIVPLEKEFHESLSKDEQNNLPKAYKHIPDKFKILTKKKPKDAVKMEYRACDLYYNHNIEIEKVARTLRGRLNKAAVLRTVKLYPHFKKYSANDELSTF